MNHYTIDTDFGTFEAEGNAALRVAIVEINAIAQLREVSQSEAFADAVKRSAVHQGKAVANTVQHPVETAKKVPGGVKRFVKRTSRRVKDLKEDAEEHYDEYKDNKAEKKARKEQEGADRKVALEAGTAMPEEVDQGWIGDTQEWWDEDGEELATQGGEFAEDYAKDWIGYTGARRHWAGELGVDPYSDNQVLNQQLLYDMGVSEETVEALYENKSQSPTLITFLVDALVKLEGVEGRQYVVDQARDADSRVEAEFHLRGVNFLATYHELRMPLESLVDAEVYPRGLTSDGTMVIAAPFDHVHWTEELATLVEAWSTTLSREGVEAVEVWIEGGTSENTRTALERYGFQVHMDSFLGMKVTFGAEKSVTGSFHNEVEQQA